MRIEFDPGPTKVTPIQIRKALRRAGLFKVIDDAITADEELAEAWDYALEFTPNDPTLAAAFTAAGLSDADRAGIFRLAGTF